MNAWAKVFVLVGVMGVSSDGFGQLLGRWVLGEGSGTVAADSSGSGNNASVPGGGGWTDDVPPTGFANQWALEFNGINGHVDTTWDGFGGAVPRTVSFWVKTTASNDHGIVAWGNSTLNGGKWHLRVNSNANNGQVGAIRTEVQGDFHIGTTVINDGEWHHVVSIFPADPATGTVDDVLHYVDGVLEGISGVGGGSPLVDTDNFADFMTIGRRRQGAALRAFPGLVDDVRVYDRDLSAVEVEGLMGASPTTDGMVAYYDFEEGSGEVVTDAGSNGIDGILVDVVSEPVVLWSDDAPAMGGLTGSMEFNGLDTWMETDFKGVGGTNPRTVAMWLKADPSMGSTDNGILGWGRTATGQKWHVRINQGLADGELGAFRVEVEGGRIVGTTDVADGTWHHVAVTWEDDGTPDIEDALLYVDGVLEVGSTAGPTVINTNITAADSLGVQLGRRIQGATPRLYVGNLADVRIYGQALSAAEIVAVMNGGDPGGGGGGEIFRVTRMVLDPVLNELELWWASEGNASYRVMGSDDLADGGWTVLASGIDSEGAETSARVGPFVGAGQKWVRVEREE